MIIIYHYLIDISHDNFQTLQLVSFICSSAIVRPMAKRQGAPGAKMLWDSSQACFQNQLISTSVFCGGEIRRYQLKPADLGHIWMVLGFSADL